MLELDKSRWQRIRFGDVIESVALRVDDPSAAGVDRYVGLEHLEPGRLTVGRWGSPDQVSAQKLMFAPGDVIFGRRRAYQKKVARADFAGICSAHALVLRPKPGAIHPDFLPVFLSSDYFLDRAVSISVGSLSPTVNWRDLAVQEFDLPPMQDQERLARLLWRLEDHSRLVEQAGHALARAEANWSDAQVADMPCETPIKDVLHPNRPLCYGVVQPGDEAEDGIGLVRVLDLEGSGPRVEGLKRVSEAVDAQYRRSRIAANDVLLSIVGTIGRTWIVTDEFAGCNIARALARLSPDPSLMRSAFLHWVLASAPFQQTLTSAAFESARKTLNLAVLADLRVPVPSLAEQDRLLEEHRLMAQARAATEAEMQSVRDLRQALLSNVFGGCR